MHSHININFDGQDLELGEGFSIDIEDSNPLWNEDEMFSYPVQIPLEGNRTILSNIEDIHSDIRPIDYEHHPVRITVDGMPFRSGMAVMTDGEQIEDSLTMNVEAAAISFSDLISDLKCRDIPVKDKILIGEKIGNVTCNVNYEYKMTIEFNKKEGMWDHIYIGKKSGSTSLAAFQPQALGFSYPAKCNVENKKTQKAKVASTRSYNDGVTVNIPSIYQSYINVSEEYPNAKYANARVCYKHYAKADDGSTSSELVDPDSDKNGTEGHYPYWVLDADRPQSGICFYVMYFLDCLFAHLGVNFIKDDLMAIPDLKRLVFFTTHCKYTTEELKTDGNPITFSGQKNNPSKSDLVSMFSGVNDWLSSRGCGGKLSLVADKVKNIENVYVDGNLYHVGEKGVKNVKVTNTVTYAEYSAQVLQMFASSDNFPDASVSSIISSLENQFGIRFNYDYERNTVTAYLLRNVYRNNVKPNKFLGNVLSMNKISEKITGVRVCYSAESDSKEQRDNVRNGVKDYDTDYDYIEYPKDRTITGKVYSEIFQNVYNNDMNVYIDKTTGNAYRVKISSEATDAASMRPVLFEVGGYKGVEIGDCSDINEDFVREFASDFTPVIFNDVNYRKELEMSYNMQLVFKDEDTGTTKEATLNAGTIEPILAAYIDVDMEHEFIEQKIQNVMSDPYVNYYVVETLKLQESYDPSDTEDGNSPLQDYDWGLSIAVMRGGGTDAKNDVYDADYDGFGNARWRTVAGMYAMTSDSIDNFGNIYDYNGVTPGVGDEERFSLKIRAYKTPEWATDKLCNADVANRGTFDTFMSEAAHFLLNRIKYIITVEAPVATLADIPNHWKERYDINGVIGYINKVSYSISADIGISTAEIEFYAL